MARDRVECDACPRPAVYRATVTHATNEETKAKLCVPHGQLAAEYKHDYTPSDQRKAGKTNLVIDETKKEQFRDLVKDPKRQGLADLLCDPDRISFKGTRIFPPPDLDPPGYGL